MEFIKPFLLGGGIIAGAKYLSTKVDPAYAPLLSGAPTGIITTFFLLNQKVQNEYYRGYIVTSTILTIAVISIYLGTVYLKSVSTNVVAVFGLIIWAVLAFFGVKFQVSHKKKGK